MPEMVADPLLPSCYHLLSRPGIGEYQSLGPDPFLYRARDARGRFAKGSSGNPRGRPRGIPNPKRRVPDLVARPLSAQALSDLTASLTCCGPSPRNCCRRRSPPSTRRSVSGSTCRRRAGSRISSSCCPLFWRPLRGARSRRPRARASRGGCVPGCAQPGASLGANNPPPRRDTLTS